MRTQAQFEVSSMLKSRSPCKHAERCSNTITPPRSSSLPRSDTTKTQPQGRSLHALDTQTMAATGSSRQRREMTSNARNLLLARQDKKGAGVTWRPHTSRNPPLLTHVLQKHWLTRPSHALFDDSLFVWLCLYISCHS